MTPELVTAVGWCAAALLGGLHVRTRQRLVLIARASHELRGPLCAARLGLGTIAGEPGRVAAIDLELARAGRALDDLAAAPSGARAPERRERVDVAALAREYAPAWTTLAAAHGSPLRLELDPPAPPEPEPVRRHLRAVPDGGGERAPSPPPDGRTRLALLAPYSPRRSAAADDGYARLARQLQAGSSIPSTVVFADPFRIAQAVSNLVSNAAEHGGGVVCVRVRGMPDRVWIEVADEGPGLPAPVAALTGAARTRTGRRGHGLAIAAAIAAQLGGRLAAMPAPAGARLVLDLPAAR